MLYSKIQYPSSFKILKPEVRYKAIEIANILIEEGLSQGVAEEIAKVNSMEMARNLLSPGNDIADCTVHVIPHPDGWAVVSQDVKKVYAAYESRKDAVAYARSYAKCVKFKLFIHSSLGTIEDSQNFIVNRPVAISKNREAVSRSSIR